jgi:hypothetical protein
MGNNEAITEADAIAAVDRALSALEDDRARERVLAWALSKYGPSRAAVGPPVAVPGALSMSAVPADILSSDQLSGAAQLWLRRNAIPVDDRLARIFSLDQTEIDLIAHDVPSGSVFLLRGACSYLATGEFRFADEQVRTACRHYNAYHQANFANYLKSFSDEIAGNKDTGYTLTAKGQRGAIDRQAAALVSSCAA